ncbi:hypothetical protein BDN72DRAFT_880692 [Pluteus cervinus]|uniref:Uncharacterized protein n=1 Tax=Pluteus cervinus TaxID=181527 RepID=A0ACD3AKL5_9AGAR|nr:hypothetical protein BDN72DRAFT_880692 [Pluteus cervinus]
MLQERLICPPRPEYPFYITAKRYWLQAFEAHANDPEALTLIVLHSTSFHKETWEPALHDLFGFVVKNGRGTVKIREAWAIDCPNHGEAAVLNEEMLMRPEYANHFSCAAYATAVHRFLSAGPRQGPDGWTHGVDFRKRKLVGLGHSLGANAILILQRREPIFNFSFLIIVEPMLSPLGSKPMERLRSKLVMSAYERRDVWGDASQARKTFRESQAKRWDPRVLDTFIDFGLRIHPGSRAEVAPYHGVTLACTREQEAAMYRDTEGLLSPVEDLNHICKRKRVHLILGGKNDYIPKRVHKAIVDPSSGRIYASTRTLEAAGHLIPQEFPEELAAYIYDILLKEPCVIAKL